MKQLDPKLLTFCYGCVFAEMNKNTQVGCKIDKLSEFSDKAYKNYKDTFYYVGQPKCMYHRTSDWKHNCENITQMKFAARQEITLPIHINIECEDSVENLENTIESINNQYLQPKSTKIFVNIPTTIEEKIKITEICSKLKHKYEAVFMEEKIKNLREYAIYRTKEPFLFFIKCGVTIDKDVLLNIDQDINDNNQEYVFIWSENNDILFFVRPLYETMFPRTINDIVEQFKDTQPSFSI